jgi:hypothetical protein
MIANIFDKSIPGGETVNREKWVVSGCMDQKGVTGFLQHNPFNAV